MSEARDKLRAASLGAPAVRSSKRLIWNGCEYEVRRPSLREQRAIDDASTVGKGKHAAKDGIRALVHALIRCVVVPGTDERVFEAADVDVMENRGAEDFVGVFAKAIAELSKEEEPGSIEKNSEGAQTAER